MGNDHSKHQSTSLTTFLESFFGFSQASFSSCLHFLTNLLERFSYTEFLYHNLFYSICRQITLYATRAREDTTGPYSKAQDRLSRTAPALKPTTHDHIIIKNGWHSNVWRKAHQRHVPWLQSPPSNLPGRGHRYYLVLCELHGNGESFPEQGDRGSPHDHVHCNSVHAGFDLFLLGRGSNWSVRYGGDRLLHFHRFRHRQRHSWQASGQSELLLALREYGWRCAHWPPRELEQEGQHRQSHFLGWNERKNVFPDKNCLGAKYRPRNLVLCFFSYTADATHQEQEAWRLCQVRRLRKMVIWVWEKSALCCTAESVGLDWVFI